MKTIQLPPYFYRNFEHDATTDSLASSYKKQALRITLATLPFFSLYKPFGYGLSLTLGSARLFTAGHHLYANGSGQSVSQYVSVAASIAGIAGTCFAHPLGMLIATVHDLFLDIQCLAGKFLQGDYRNAILELLPIINNILYAGIFLGGGSQLIATSLCIQFLIGIKQSHSHFQKKGEELEAVSHGLMAFIRGHQAIRSWQHIFIEQEIQKAREDNKPYLPLANQAQRFFVNAGYQINGLARWTVRQIGHLFLSPIPEERYLQEVADRVQTAIKVAFAIPCVAASFFLSMPCYVAASYVGTGRFEKIEATSSSNAPQEKEIKVVFQNICGQNPWSVFSGGVLPPLEKDSEGIARVDSLIDHILQENPDVYCGQEFDDLATSEAIGKALAQEGYTCFRDLGCNDPIRNHSGLFMAVRGPTDSVAFHPFQPEHVSGIAHWCHRGIMEVNVPLQNGRDIKIINVHLNPGGEEHQNSRLVQLGTYVSPLMNQHRSVVVGDS
ncbi:MAG: endonuclease/exonuclease/phosphatase family protein, partial [Chlamydiales bacterium]|nr:endonuclease/exonuclease/phosphatase family protein [Chlamydiales bacterium]